MPNTLVHLGVQGVATRAFFRVADIKWIFLGATLPDIPWILRRVVLFAIPEVDPLDLRLYVIAQSSLFGCLLLAAAISLLTRRPWIVFAVLGGNAFVHLLIDALQTKWGNGVHLLAPLSWDIWNAGLFWPENWITHVLTIWGLIFVVVIWRKKLWGDPIELQKPNTLKVLAAVVLISGYGFLPFAAAPGILRADAHYTATIANPCAGCSVAFDREDYRKGPATDMLVTWAGYYLIQNGPLLDHPATVSIKGVFVDKNRIRVEKLYEHDGMSRDVPSYIGLLFLTLIFIRDIVVIRN